MSKHTPEPWALFEVGDGRPHLCPASESDKMSILTIAEEDGVTFACVYKDSDANRIVTCVNACAGMADPAAEIAELKRQRDSFQLEAINCHEMLCVEIERTTNLIAELGFVSEYATKSVMGFCKGDEKSIFDFSKFMEGIFNRYDIELSAECEELLNEGKFTKPKHNLN